MLKKLKPCPFCGKEPYIQKRPVAQRQAIYAVKCHCGVLTHFQDRQYKAIGIWNKRASEPASGLWVGEGDGYADGELVYDVWYCSECNHCIDDGTDNPDLLPNFCPDCGAKMCKEATHAS